MNCLTNSYFNLSKTKFLSRLTLIVQKPLAFFLISYPDVPFDVKVNELAVKTSNSIKVTDSWLDFSERGGFL